MFRGKETSDAIREAYSYLFPKKKELKAALARVDLDTVVQSLRYRAEEIFAYQTTGTDDMALMYRGSELFHQRGCRIHTRVIRHHSTEIEASYLRELWILEDARFVEVSVVKTKYRSGNEGFYTAYRTLHHVVKGEAWREYPPDEVADMFEDFSKYPFDSASLNYCEV